METAILSASAHRKIDLQSPADLAHIHAHLSRAARDKIDRALPPAAAPEGEEDMLRRRVEEMVDGYVRAVWEGVRSNVRVNGLDMGSKGDVMMGAAREGEDNLESFDARLADRLRALEAQKEGLTERVADLRRMAPRAAARHFEERFVAENERAEMEDAEARERSLLEAGEARIDLGGVGALGRWDEVKSTWERGTEGLVGLKAGLGETRAKVERAGEVVGYVEGRG